MKLIAFILINYAYQVTSSKLPLRSVLDNKNIDVITSQLNTDSLNTRDVSSDYYGSYMPADYYGNLSFVSDWIRRFLPTFQPPVYDTQTYSPISADYNQEQWSSPNSPYEWNQNLQSNPDTNRYYYYPNAAAEDAASTYYADPYQQQPQPAVTKKISTIFNTEDSKEIKHKVIISPEYPNGTGYISIGEAGGKQTSGNSSKDGKDVAGHFGDIVQLHTNRSAWLYIFVFVDGRAKPTHYVAYEVESTNKKKDDQPSKSSLAVNNL